MTRERFSSLYTTALERVGSEDRAQCLDPERIREVAAGQLTEPERLASLDHIMRCPYCVREFKLLRAITQAAAKPRRSVGFLQLAAAASVTLVIAAGVWRMARSPDNVFRGDANTISLVQPLGSVPMDEARLFRWTGAGSDVTYRLEVFGPDGSVLVEATTRDTSFVMADSIVFNPGQSYRWWIRATSLNGHMYTTEPADLLVTSN